VTSGATIICSGTSLTFFAESPCFYNGITWQYTGTTTGFNVNVSSSSKTQYFSNCVMWLNTASTVVMFQPNSPYKVTLENTSLKFGSANQRIFTNAATIWQADIAWYGGSVQGTAPTTLFVPSATAGVVTVRGVDMSPVTGTLVANGGADGSKYLFDSCKIASGVVRYSTTSVANCYDEVELINCYDGTNIISERHHPAGDVTTETTITLSGGATDDVGTYSHKMVSTANCDKYVNPLCGFWLDIENTATGSSKTATVEIISSATLNNDDISLYLQYEGTSGSSIASFVSSLPATVLTTASAVTSSTATWNSSPATPQRQKLQVTFTAQHAGRVRGQVRLGKASTTVYIDPRIVIS